MPQKECGKRSSITFFRFWDAFGHFSVTFSDAFVTFSSLFCRTPFTGLLLRQGEQGFSSFWALFGGGGVKPNFADKNFMDTQTFLSPGLF